MVSGYCWEWVDGWIVALSRLPMRLSSRLLALRRASLTTAVVKTLRTHKVNEDNKLTPAMGSPRGVTAGCYINVITRPPPPPDPDTPYTQHRPQPSPHNPCCPAHTPPQRVSAGIVSFVMCRPCNLGREEPPAGKLRGTRRYGTR
ncbi:hypothetical protein E2C01_014231 [Portunus trituberculatus]|uniref:Uncharacterized protein n=1 Tax=Portunus trituberculatus TaxID=210409 RepID=A0A5B7DJG0_PORTR|nr:hypothetical protein [Portunus trituberculatus]